MLPEIEPRTFSFNTPHGACPDCQGLGGKLEIDPDLLIPDPDLSLNEGAIVAMRMERPARGGRLLLADRWRPRPSTTTSTWTPRCSDLPPEKLDIILYGTQGKEVPIHYRNTRWAASPPSARAFEGVIGNLERRYRETNSEYIRERITEFMSEQHLPHLRGHAPAPGSPGGHRRRRQHRRGHPLADAAAPWTGPAA